MAEEDTEINKGDKWGSCPINTRRHDPKIICCYSKYIYTEYIYTPPKEKNKNRLFKQPALVLCTLSTIRNPRSELKGTLPAGGSALQTQLEGSHTQQQFIAQTFG